MFLWGDGCSLALLHLLLEMIGIFSRLLKQILDFQVLSQEVFGCISRF